MERVVDRFDKYLRTKGLNDNQVTVSLGLSQGLIGKSRGKGRDLSSKLANKILDSYPDLSRVWLLTGEGEMLNGGSSQTIPATIELQTQTELNEKNAVKWYYELDASAGDGLFEDNEINAPYKYINVPGFEGCFGLNLTGDSMLNTAQSGDIVVVRPREVQTIINGEIYLVVTRDSQRMVKRLVASGYSEDAIITCISDNPDKTRYADMKIQADLIHKIFRVAGFVSIKRMA
jgi:Predicted transcriptional regulator|nr:MAG TPA: hypothetical protein [Caudoviricetes sp.]